MELPTIVLDEMIPGSSNWASTRKQVVDALEEYGCFRAIYSAISPEQDSRFFNALQDLFDLPKETKRRFTSETHPLDGYRVDLPNLPLYEAMGMTDALNSQKVQNLANLMWPPNGNPTFCECYNLHASKMADLDKMIRRMVFEGYGMDKYFEAHDKAIDNSMHVMRYGTPMSSVVKVVGAVPHYDVHFITILHENGVQGLQVKAKSSDHWITEINGSDSSFIVMAGESLLGWSNGRIHCSLHKVMLSGNKPRFSIGHFSSVEGLVEAPSELIDDDHPRLFKPFDRMGLLNVLKSRVGSEADMSLPIITSHFTL